MKLGCSSLGSVLLIALILFLGTNDSTADTIIYKPEIERTFRHDRNLYTQGLLFHNGFIYESSGLYNKSTITKWEIVGDQLVLDKKLSLPGSIFAEGLTLAQKSIYALTWKEGLVLKINPDSLELEETIFTKGEGWGVTWDESNIWRSDGSSTLFRHHLADFSLDGEINVSDKHRSISKLNELEWDPVGKVILANIWHQNRVVAISPDSGQVKFWLDFSGIVDKEHKINPNPEAVLNGLALQGQEKLWLTGKNWSNLYQISWPPTGQDQ